MDAQVVVVGAGLSGLTAARRLARAGVTVLVLEARERVGGRAWRIEVGGLPFDAGCELLWPRHERLLALAGELGVPVLGGPDLGRHPQPTAAALAALGEEIALLAARIDPSHPEAVEDAGALDEQTLGGWLEEHGADEAALEEAETSYAVASSTVPIGEMSLLAYAAKLAAGASPDEPALRLAGGPRALVDALARDVEVRLDAEVVGVAQDGEGVSLALRDGSRVRAGRTILAVPLTLQRELRIDPALPAHRQQALAEARYGDAVKAGFAFHEAPDRELPELTPAGFLYRPDPALPLLALFAGSGAARRAAAFSFGDRAPHAATAVDWTAEAFTRGSYLIFGRGHLTSWGRRLGESHGRLHFAGAETSGLPSFMEGAVRAGERAADEVSAAG